jgi:hypothetical protein
MDPIETETEIEKQNNSEFIHVIEDDDSNLNSNSNVNLSKDTKSIGEKIDDSIDWINEFLYNTIIYFGDIYKVVNELFDPFKNWIKSMYDVKMKNP